MADERFLRIDKYAQYQHYKERTPPWVKQHRSFWTNYGMCQQSATTRLLALFLISYASEFKECVIPCNILTISRRIGLSKVTVKKGLEALIQAKFLVECASPELAECYLPSTEDRDRGQRTEEEKALLVASYPAKEQPQTYGRE